MKSAQNNLNFAIASNQITIMMDYLSQHPNPEHTFIEWWNKQNKIVLPSAQGFVKSSANGIQVNLQWGKNQHLSTET